MAMRQLVTGADACGPSDGSEAGPANAAAALANQLLGMGNDKTQERLHQVRRLCYSQADLCADA